MTNISGTYEVVANTPVGSQDMTLTVQAQGDTFTGTSKGQLGSTDISGSIEGNTMRWTQPITVPMPLTITCEATISGDDIDGSVDTGAFGAFPIVGKRVA